MLIRTYSELAQLDTFEDRYEYLRLKGNVGESTFGYERHINQSFYRSREWKLTRMDVIARDLGNDLGVIGHDIHSRIYIHHMNPMTPEDIEYGNADILNPEYLITTTHDTHNAIHFGDFSRIEQPLIERRPGDHILWNPLT